MPYTLLVGFLTPCSRLPGSSLLPPPFCPCIIGISLFYVLVTAIDSPSTHFLIFNRCNFIPPPFLSHSVFFPRLVAHIQISCPAMFCNHYHRWGTLDWGRNVWFDDYYICLNYDRLELFREYRMVLKLAQRGLYQRGWIAPDRPSLACRVSTFQGNRFVCRIYDIDQMLATKSRCPPFRGVYKALFHGIWWYIHNCTVPYTFPCVTW